MTLIRNLIFALLFLSSLPLRAVAPLEVFKKHPNKYFIETGTYQGDGIQLALSANFQEVYSIELSPYHYMCSSNRFKFNPHVHLYLGNSATVLPELLEKVDAPATFWLDGHYSSGTTGRGETNTPILQELEAIRHHSITTHTILIDDVRLFGTVEFDFIELEEIIQKIYQINPEYRISFEQGYVKGDILVAKVKTWEN